jgi:hypothetical protein
LNFYYLLIWGGFDHLALVVRETLGLGVPEKNVGATYKTFLDPLKMKAPEIHTLFTDPNLDQFITRIGALRHFAAHRGSIMPTEIYAKPEVEPTIEGLDADIAKSGEDDILAYLPAGDAHDSARDFLRFKAKMARLEKVADNMVLVKTAENQYFLNPMADIEWNYQKFHSFMLKVLKACQARL